MEQMTRGEVRAQVLPMFVLALLLACNAAPADLPEYQLRDLGTLGGDFTYPTDINDAGQVVGYSETGLGLQTHGFLYASGRMTDLGTLGGFISYAYAINEAGEVVGEAAVADGSHHAFLYTSEMLIDLGTVAGGYSGATSINNLTQVAGYSAATAVDYHAFLYTDTDGVMATLGTLGDSYSRAEAINDAGQVAGIYAQQFETHAFLYTGGSMIDLVPGAASFVDATPRIINNLGQVTGTYIAADLPRAFVYRDGGMVDLGTLGGEASIGYAVNEAAQITGFSTTLNGETHAFVHQQGTMIDLGTLGGTFSIGYDINEAGQVTGFSNTALTGPAAGANRPFVYADGKMIELDIGALSPHVVEGGGLAINNSGQVIGWYSVLGGDTAEPITRAFLGTPVRMVFTKLARLISGTGPGQSLQNKLRTAQRSYAQAHARASCAIWPGFAQEVRAHAGKTIPRARATEILAEVNALKVALRC